MPRSLGTVTAVPSSKGRAGQHPLVQAIGMVSSLAKHYEELLVPGRQPARHLAARDDAFIADARVDGRRVLLVDDTFTSGAQVQSAASALQLASAIIPAAVVIGRFTKPRFNEATRLLWERVSEREFTFDRCCLCEPAWPRP
jgi:predicted amidophosphoribosyltransferase